MSPKGLVVQQGRWQTAIFGGTQQHSACLYRCLHRFETRSRLLSSWCGRFVLAVSAIARGSASFGALGVIASLISCRLLVGRGTVAI